MKVNIKGKFEDIPARKVSGMDKYIGLMFKSRKTDNLLFEFSQNESKTIHSFFVFFPFLALWLDEKNKLIDSEVVKPFTPIVKPKKSATKLIEIPLNKENYYLFNLIVGKRKDLNI